MLNLLCHENNTNVFTNVLSHLKTLQNVTSCNLLLEVNSKFYVHCHYGRETLCFILSHILDETTSQL